jgi:hypothetical protein
MCQVIQLDAHRERAAADDLSFNEWSMLFAMEVAEVLEGVEAYREPSSQTELTQELARTLLRCHSLLEAMRRTARG